MAGAPADASKDTDEDFDFGIDDLESLDDEELSRLLEEDPSLEEELRAIEAAEEAGDTPPYADPSAAADEPSGRVAPVDMPPADEPPREEPPVQDPPRQEASEPELPPIENDTPARTSAFDDLDDLDFDDPADHGTEEPEAVSATSEETSAHLEEEGLDPTALNLTPVPRINIHAFCTTDRTTGLIEASARDRRLAKAHLTIHAGDARRAADIYAGEGSPNLLLIEATGSPEEFLAGLDELAGYCDPSTRVICIGALNDIRLYRELMNRGISEYLVSPQSPLQIIAAIGELYADPSAPAVGKSYVFVGARGGSGSSTVCHNVAWALAEDFSTDTVLMDLDLPFGTASLDFEHDPSQGLADALAAPERLDDVLLDRLLQKCTDRLSLFVAPNLLDRDYDLPAESYEVVIDMVRKTAPAVAIDLPHVWSGWARYVLQSADEIVITVTPDLSSFRNAKNLIETVKASRANDSEPILVLNQVGVPKRPEVPTEQFKEALGIAPSAVIPWDPVSFGMAATNAQAVAEAAPKAKAVPAFLDVGAKLTGRPISSRSSGFSFKSLFSKSG